MRPELRPVEGDIFDIASRLKEIDGRYELYFNAKARRYEIWAEGELQAVSPFRELDARTLEHARRTRIERIAAIEAEIEKENLRLERIAKARAAEAAAVRANELLKA